MVAASKAIMAIDLRQPCDGRQTAERSLLPARLWQFKTKVSEKQNFLLRADAPLGLRRTP